MSNPAYKQTKLLSRGNRPAAYWTTPSLWNTVWFCSVSGGFCISHNVPPAHEINLSFADLCLKLESPELSVHDQIRWLFRFQASLVRDITEAEDTTNTMHFPALWIVSSHINSIIADWKFSVATESPNPHQHRERRDMGYGWGGREGRPQTRKVGGSIPGTSILYGLDTEMFL